MTQFQNQILHGVYPEQSRRIQDDNSTSVILSRAKNLPRSYLVQYSHYPKMSHYQCMKLFDSVHDADLYKRLQLPVNFLNKTNSAYTGPCLI